MGIIHINKLEPGMVLADEVRDISEIHNKIMVHNMRQYYTKTFLQNNGQKVKLLN
jgi:hypothetical protein